jgi:hypothetical protein
MKKLKVGDKVETWISAPWDDSEPMRITGKIVRSGKRLFFECDQSTSYNDFVSEYKHLRLV